MALLLEQFLPYRFNRMAEILSKNASQTYKSEYGLTRPEWRAFALLGQYGTMTATEISYYSTMHKTKVSRAIFTLEEKRWIVRGQDEKDRRIEKINLTSVGKQAYDRLVPLMLKVETDVIARLGEANSKALEQGLDALEALFLDPGESRKTG
jgi:DNA-binding MarR family transcriptional regulator